MFVIIVNVRLAPVVPSGVEQLALSAGVGMGEQAIPQHDAKLGVWYVSDGEPVT